MKSLRIKLVLSYVVVLFLLVVVAIISYSSITSFGNQVRTLVREDFVLLESYHQLSHAITERLALARGYQLYPTNTSFYDDFRSRTREIDLLEQELLKNERAQSIYPLIEMSREWATAAENNVFALINVGDLAGAEANAKPLVALGNEILEGFDTALNQERHYVNQREDELANLRSNSTRAVVIFSLAACASGLLLAFLLANSIANPIVNVSERLKLVADGDLTGTELSVRAKDEVGQLVSALNHVVFQLREMVLTLDNGAVELASSSEQLSASTEENGAAVLWPLPPMVC
ncbi:MAG: methyl-accepting chemotaxis protein [Firmicutes bacterium]|nr:methyl-accepting chemotaxis protein [Bacillota bacterium]